MTEEKGTIILYSSSNDIIKICLRKLLQHSYNKNSFYEISFQSFIIKLTKPKYSSKKKRFKIDYLDVITKAKINTLTIINSFIYFN